MKSFLLGCRASLALVLAGIANIAHAADVSVSEKHPVYQPVTRYDWSGFYVGLNSGGSWGISRFNFAVPGTGRVGTGGGMFGGTVGANDQIGHLVLGLESDLDAADVSGSGTCLVAGLTCSSRNDWLGTVRGRIGYAFDRFMPYVTGGAAFGDLKASVPASGSIGSNQTGWTVGGGIEYALSNKWTIKLEYLHVDFGNINWPPVRVHFDEDTVRAGINYKFNWSGPNAPQ
jgi:outer membrane immunogenic protein